MGRQQLAQRTILVGPYYFARYAARIACLPPFACAKDHVCNQVVYASVALASQSTRRHRGNFCRDNRQVLTHRSVRAFGNRPQCHPGYQRYPGCDLPRSGALGCYRPGEEAGLVGPVAGALVFTVWDMVDNGGSPVCWHRSYCVGRWNEAIPLNWIAPFRHAARGPLPGLLAVLALDQVKVKGRQVKSAGC
jgi:hypothetical protein